MKLLNDMLKIDSLRIWGLPNGLFGVAFQTYASIKDGDFLKGEFGEGRTPEDAVRDYARKISGRTLVANPMSENRKEITIILLEDDKWVSLKDCFDERDFDEKHGQF